MLGRRPIPRARATRRRTRHSRHARRRSSRSPDMGRAASRRTRSLGAARLDAHGAPTGDFSFRYRTSGDTSAIYFATTSYGGIVYPTSPFRGPVVSGDDAMITVFDTTSGPVRDQDRRPTSHHRRAERERAAADRRSLRSRERQHRHARSRSDSVYAGMDGAHSGVGRRFQLNTNGELAAGAISRNGSSVGLFAPLSPGIRQLAFTYELPSSAFPSDAFRSSDRRVCSRFSCRNRRRACRGRRCARCRRRVPRDGSFVDSSRRTFPRTSSCESTFQSW